MSGGRTRAEIVSQQIADDILSGVLRPGDRLEEYGLARRYGLSRTPVREALHRLAAAGLIDLNPRRGARVSLPDEGTLAELFELLGELEASCASFAAVRMSPAERARLSSAHAGAFKVASRGDVESYVRRNREFHEAIYLGSHNGSLVSAVRSMRERMAPFSCAEFAMPGRLLQSNAEHCRVIAGIMASNAAAAASAMRCHVAGIQVASADSYTTSKYNSTQMRALIISRQRSSSFRWE